MTPSRVEIYVNDQLVRVEQLPPGVYQLNHLPLPVGAGNTRVVVRDAFGGQPGVRLFVLHQRGSAGTRSSAIRHFGRHGAAATLRIELCVWRSGPPWTSSGRSHRQHHDGWSHRNGPRHAEWWTGCDRRIGRLGEVETIAALSRSDGRSGYAGSIA